MPIVIDSNGVIVAGHTRYKAAKKLNLKEVPCIVADDLTEEQIKAFRLADNKVAEKAEWDFDLLSGELDELFDFDMSVFGFDEEEEEKPVEVVEDDFEAEIPEEPKAKFGQIYQLGRHRLMCGDSTDKAMVEKLMDGKIADIGFTSPPYNVGKNSSLSANTHMTKSKYLNSDDDLVDYDELLFNSTENGINSTRWSFVNIQMLAENKIVFCRWLNEFATQLCDINIWYKTNTAPAMAERVMNSQFEFVVIFGKENNSRAIGTKQFRGTVSNVFQCSPQRKNEFAEIHSATFSLDFVSHYINEFTNKDDSVLDLFGGTGTTLIACEQLNRDCFMMELDPRYVDVIIDRWEIFTGEKAVLLNV